MEHLWPIKSGPGRETGPLKCRGALVGLEGVGSGDTPTACLGQVTIAAAGLACLPPSNLQSVFGCPTTQHRGHSPMLQTALGPPQGRPSFEAHADFLRVYTHALFH